MHSGFEHAAAEHFSSVTSHVYLVYTASILLHSGLPGTVDDSDSVTEKQAEVKQILKNRETACVIHELTESGGADRLKNELKTALTVQRLCKPLADAGLQVFN